MANDILLIVGDSPTLNSGFAKVIQNLARRWKPHFQRIDFWAIHYRGYPGVPGQAAKTEWVQPSYVLYPAAPIPDELWYSLPRLQSLINHILNGDYTHVWILQDHFCLKDSKFPSVLKAACDRAKTQADGKPGPVKKSFYYVPVDAPLEPGWAAPVEAVDFPVAYTNYGRDEIVKHSGALRGDSMRVIPHGVDASVYYPMPERDKIRKERSGGWIEPGDIVLINVNANQRRKDTIRSLEILAELRKRDNRFKLIMHMADMQGSDGISLRVSAAQLGLIDGVHWQCTDVGDNFLGLWGTLSEQDLNALYNCADIYLTTTLGEGWGFGITEALAAGLTVAIPDHTACKEIADQCSKRGMEDRFIRLPLEPGTVCLNMDNSRLRKRVDIYGACKAIMEAAAKLDPTRPRTGLTDYVKKWLSWDRIAAEWLDLFRQPKPAKRVFVEIYGGLGDVFNTLYYRSAGEVLDNLAAGEQATVALYCNNPFAVELFANHPRRSQIEVIDTGLWRPELRGKWPELVQQKRAELGLPRRGGRDCLPAQDTANVKFYPTAEDAALLPDPSKPYLVLAASAGLPDRNIPGRHLMTIAERLWKLFELHGVKTYWVGRTFERHGREEVIPNDVFADGVWYVNLIDRLTVPGVAALLQNSAGVITSHSALNPLAWRMRKPQLLLYPDSVADGHYRARDQWAFGIDDPLCVRTTFDEFAADHLTAFIRLALGPLAVTAA